MSTRRPLLYLFFGLPIAGALAAGTGDDFSAFAVKVQPGRPWLRVSVTRVGTTDTHVTHCSVYAVPNGV